MKRRIIFLILFLKTFGSVIDNLEALKYMLKTQPLSEVYDGFSSLFNKNKGNRHVQHEYIKFLYESGRYKDIMNTITQIFHFEYEENNKYVLDNFLVEMRKKTERSLILETKISENIKHLLQQSPNAERFRLKQGDILLKNKDFEKCKRNAEASLIMFPQNTQFSKQLFHSMVCEGRVNAGVQGLKKYYKDYDFEPLIKISQIYSSYSKELGSLSLANFNKMETYYKKFLDLLSQIQKENKNRTFIPSLFWACEKMTLIKIVDLGLRLSKKNLKIKAKKVLAMESNDKNKYNYLLTLIVDENLEDCEQEFELYTINNKNLKNDIQNHLIRLRSIKEKERIEKEEKRKYTKEEEERQKKREQENKQRYQERQNLKDSQFSSDDPKGYYKLLGVDKSADAKEIKRAYNKLFAKIYPDQYKDKDLVKYEAAIEKLSEINAAKDVLSDKNKKRDYDSGKLQSDHRGGESQQGFANVEELLKMFSGFGGNSGGFSSGGFSSQRSYRTYSSGGGNNETFFTGFF